MHLCVRVSCGECDTQQLTAVSGLTAAGLPTRPAVMSFCCSISSAEFTGKAVMRSANCDVSCNNKAFVDIRLRPGLATPRGTLYFATLSPRIAIRPALWPNATSSIKPEVHNVAQRRQRRTEPRPQGIRTQNFARIGPSVPEICSRTDRQTHTHTQTDGLITTLCTLTGAE